MKGAEVGGTIQLPSPIRQQLLALGLAIALVQRLHAQHGLVGSVNAPLIPSDGYTCTPCMPEMPRQKWDVASQLRGDTKLIPFISVATPPTLFKEPKGACVMNSDERLSCHGWMVGFNLRTSSPEGPRQGSSHGDRRSQNRMVSPPRMISPDGARIRYFPKPVGACAAATDAPSLWSRTRKVKLCAWDASGPVGP